MRYVPLGILQSRKREQEQGAVGNNRQQTARLSGKQALNGSDEEAVQFARGHTRTLAKRQQTFAANARRPVHFRCLDRDVWVGRR